MGTAARTPCANCQRLQARVDALQAKLDNLSSELTRLREDLAAARKDSSTSSKPPSSDIVKPKPALEDGTKRSIGGQPGHPKHERHPFPAEQITHFEEHVLEGCPCCGGPVHRNADLARTVQQVDVEKPPLTIEQHTFPEYWCPQCRQPVRAPLPPHIARGGLEREHHSKAEFQRRLKEARDEVVRIGLAAPPTRHGQNMAKRFREHGEAYFTFVTTPGVEPTNNLAEQAIRFAVIDRHITQGTRSEQGRQWSERIWTVIATCAQHSKSVYEFLRAVVESWFAGTAAPSLLPPTA
jgi:hypothetical protein